MPQICLTCKKLKDLKKISKKTKKANWKIKMGINTIFPNDEIPDLNNIKISSPKNATVIQNLKLDKKNAHNFILYYASDLKASCEKIPNALNSYNSFRNKGIAQADSNGDVTIKLNCPNVYKEEGKSFYPHVHFIIGNHQTKKWDNNLYTKIVICDVKKSELASAIKNQCTILINALPFKYFIKNIIPNSISLPYSELNNLSDKDIKLYIKNCIIKYNSLNKNYSSKKIELLDVPIITYCYDKNCNASEKVIERLMNVGFKNLKEYSSGIIGWNRKRAQ